MVIWILIKNFKNLETAFVGSCWPICRSKLGRPRFLEKSNELLTLEGVQIGHPPWESKMTWLAG